MSKAKMIDPNTLTRKRLIAFFDRLIYSADLTRAWCGGFPTAGNTWSRDKGGGTDIQARLWRMKPMPGTSGVLDDTTIFLWQAINSSQRWMVDIYN